MQEEKPSISEAISTKKKAKYEFATLKIDFKKTPDGKLVILDVGNGLLAGLNGFDKRTVRRAIADSHSMDNGRVFVTSVFNTRYFESAIKEDYVTDKVKYINPAMLSNPDIRSRFKENDIFIFVDYDRVPAFCSAYYYEKYQLNISSGPNMFNLLAFDKYLFYSLQQQHKVNPEFWNRLFTSDLTDIERFVADLPEERNGYVVKLTNAESGVGFKVAATKAELLAILQATTLLRLMSENADKYHLIQPRVLGETVVDQKQVYEPTGRAFFTLRYNTETQELKITIAGLKWILPKAAYADGVTTAAAILANAENSRKFLDATQQELNWLESQLHTKYEQVFIDCFSHTAEDILASLCRDDENLQNYCKQLVFTNPLFCIATPNQEHSTESKHLQIMGTFAKEHANSFTKGAMASVDKKQFEASYKLALDALECANFMPEKKSQRPIRFTCHNVIACYHQVKGDIQAATAEYNKSLEYADTAAQKSGIANVIRNLKPIPKNSNIGNTMK